MLNILRESDACTQHARLVVMDSVLAAKARGETAPGYETSSWVSTGGPKEMRAPIAFRLKMKVNAALNDPDIKARFEDLGATPLTTSPDDFRKLVADETEKWAKVIRGANIKPE